MNAIRNILEKFLEGSSPEQLRSELTKGNRPYFQTLKDSNLVCLCQSADLPDFVQATVSFFKGNYVERECVKNVENAWAIPKNPANEELALAA
jgi:NADPH-dependent 7-cyano-7-deazaguanine reductase QueF